MPRWELPAEFLILPVNEVHLWRISVAEFQGAIDDFFKLLAADEQKRAQRFHFRKDFDRYIIARGMLRKILGQYLGITPDSIQLDYNQHGKPALNPQNWLRFNISHSQQIILFGFSRQQEIGVDVEYIRENFSHLKLARRFFAPEEFADISSLSAEQQKEAFFNCWTRKEAFIKAMGKGLAIPLASFLVTLKPGEAAALLDIKNQPEEIKHWRLYDIEIAEDYKAAVMVAGQQHHFRYFTPTSHEKR